MRGWAWELVSSVHRSFFFQAWVMQRLRVELHIKSLSQGKGI